MSFIEKFEKRCSISINQMPNKSKETLKKLSDDDLHKFIAGWKVGTADHIAGTRELNRRASTRVEIRSWIAIAIAILALMISTLDRLL